MIVKNADVCENTYIVRVALFVLFAFGYNRDVFF